MWLGPFWYAATPWHLDAGNRTSGATTQPNAPRPPKLALGGPLELSERTARLVDDG